MGYWERVGNIKEVGKTGHILFRSCRDYGVRVGEIPVKISHKWLIWKIKEEMKYVGKLKRRESKCRNWNCYGSGKYC